MSTPDYRPGQPCWRDLTVPNAPEVRAFYERVVGWKITEQPMGGYSDFNMLEPESGECVAGVCHARAANADLPPQWIIYFWVEHFQQSVDACLQHGGAVVSGPRRMGDMTYAVIRDPAGAVCAVIGR